ncbi:MAG: hypothetical protein ACR2M0_02125 [Chloroflexia bacterium]
MENPEDLGGQVSPEEAMRQLLQLRMQLGKERFATLSSQMGMPAELLDQIEESVVQVGAKKPGSGLLDASGRPIGGGSTGLVDSSGRPIGTAPSLDGVHANGVGEADEDLDEEMELDEETGREMFQELVGVRMIIGSENFSTMADQMDMPGDASEMVETAAEQIEAEIASRYSSPEEAMTVRLVNARIMMGTERFADFAAQVGMPAEVVGQVEEIAGQLESETEEGADEGADDALDEGPSLA